MRHIKLIILATVLGLMSWGASAAAQSPKEAVCDRGSAEDCFYAAADFATGKGVAENKITAQKLFLKACDKGLPDGCHYAGTMSRKGQGNVPLDFLKGVGYHERACRMGHEEACDSVYRALAMNEQYRDIPRLIIAMEAGCAKGVSSTCTYGYNILYDGWNGKYPGHTDHRRAAPMAERVCDGGRGGDYACQVTETIYANPDSPAFNAAKALKYTQLNCDKNDARACGNLGRIYHQIEEYELATTAYEKSCTLRKKETICDFAKKWREHLTKLAAYEAKQAQEQALIDGYLNAGKYGSAVNVALHQLRSGKHAQIAATAAINANAMRQVNTQDLYVLASWFRSGPIHDAVNRAMAARGTGLEGRFGTGTNNTGQAAKRYRDLYGSSMPSRSVSNTPSSQPSGLSTAQARADVRRKYRHAHCTMNGNANRNVCR